VKPSAWPTTVDGIELLSISIPHCCERIGLIVARICEGLATLSRELAHYTEYVSTDPLFRKLLGVCVGLDVVVDVEGEVSGGVAEGGATAKDGPVPSETFPLDVACQISPLTGSMLSQVF